MYNRELKLLMNIVVFGAGGHAKSVIDVVEQEGRYRITGLLDANKPAGTEVYGYSVLGDESWLSAHMGTVTGGIVAIGDNWIRSTVAARLLAVRPGFTFISAIHPSASLARGATVGAGSVIMAGAVINSDAVIGEHCILYPNTSVDHDSAVGSFVSFAPKAATGGSVHIGHYTAIALGANIIHSVSIGDHTVIGAGATVITDIPSHTVAYGVPARCIRKREAGERYL